MKKIMVIDTNVLLEDSKAFLTFKKHDVVIPYKVIEEMEKHKTSKGEVGMNARDCGRTIASLLESHTTNSLKDGIKLPNGGKLFVVSSADFKDVVFDFPLEAGDDHILAVCVGIKERWEGYSPVLVSNDTMLRLRANGVGVKCETYDSVATVNNVDDLYTGYKTIKVSEEIIAKYWEEHKNSIFSISPKELTKEKLFLNDFIILTNDSNGHKKKPYPILRVKEIDKKKELCFVHETKLGNDVKPKNIEQVMALDLLMDPTVSLVTLTGMAGTGKTMLTLAAGLEQIIEKKTYSKLIIIRPMHSVGKEVGFLPGNLKEKLDPWVAPIKDNLKAIYGKENIDYMLNNNVIEIDAMTYIRGRSIDNSFILIDEAQNTDIHEIKTILTRAGNNSKIVLGGDIFQTDRNDVDSISNGLSIAIEKFKEYGISGHVFITECLRSELAALAAKIL